LQTKHTVYFPLEREYQQYSIWNVRLEK